LAVKRKEGENLTKENIARVIEHLEQGITKKEACEMLKISYNTSRLAKIISEHNEMELYSLKRRKALRGTRVSDLEKKQIIENYLSGDSLSSLSESTYRSVQTIKSVLSAYNVPIRSASNNYFSAVMFDEGSWKDSYEDGDLVYSARYNRPCTIKRLIQVHKEHGNCYVIQFHGEDRYTACQPAYELADLTAIQKEHNIELTDMGMDDVRHLLYEAYLKSKKMDKVKR